MTVLMSLFAGVAVMLALSLAAAWKVDRFEVREMFALILGTLAAPVLMVGERLSRSGWFLSRVATVDARTVERFAAMRRPDGTAGMVFVRGRFGVLWMRELRPEDKAPPRRIYTLDQVFGGRYTTVKRAS